MELLIFDCDGVLWRGGTGDSDMLDYAPICDEVLMVRNLAQLSAAVDMLLSSS